MESSSKRIKNARQICSYCKVQNPECGFTKSNPYSCYDCARKRKSEKVFIETGKRPKPRKLWVDGLKVCNLCGVPKANGEYPSLTNSWCISCIQDKMKARIGLRDKPKNPRPRSTRDKQNAHLRREYGITVEEKEKMLSAQQGKCAICSTAEPGGRGWVVDHCHTLLKVRGVLCEACNKMLGFAKDHPSTMLSAFRYLVRHLMSQKQGTMTVGVPKPDDEWEYEANVEMYEELQCA